MEGTGGASGHELGPTMAMVVVQVGYAGLNVLSKLAMDSGMSPYVMIAYRQLVATLFLLPFALLAERKTRMKLSRAVLFQIFVSSIFGATMNQLLYFMGLKYSTPTMACALNNMLPAITFLMAVPFRMETVGMGTVAGKAKVVGTIFCVGGSMVMTFYRGGLIKMWPSHIHWRYAETAADAGVSSATADEHTKMALGAALVIASCVSWSVWFIIQARMSRSFSSPYTSSALMCGMAGVESLVVGAAAERELSAWALGWNIRLAAVLYTGIIASGAGGGPLFVSMFTPLLLVIVAVLGWAVLDEKLYVGMGLIA